TVFCKIAPVGDSKLLYYCHVLYWPSMQVLFLGSYLQHYMGGKSIFGKRFIVFLGIQ
ncbi:hypothetical protein BHE74_00008059, partial [Ensete ventricosum]